MGGDKLSHCLSFLVYTLLLFGLFRLKFWPPGIRKRPALLAAFCALLIAGLDEVSQMYRAGRSPDVLDFVGDGCGVGLGLALIFIFRKIRGGSAVGQGETGQRD